MFKVLTVKNPWAWLIAQGIKDIENRTWRTHYRGRVFIHAAQGLTKGYYGSFLPYNYWVKLSESEKTDLSFESKETTSQILCSVEIVDCVQNHESIWADHSEPEFGDKPIWNWVLANPQPEPEYAGLKIKGALSFWEFSENRVIGKEVENG